MVLKMAGGNFEDKKANFFLIPRVLDLQNGLTTLAGHSYGNVVIIEAGANASNIIDWSIFPHMHPIKESPR